METCDNCPLNQIPADSKEQAVAVADMVRRVIIMPREASIRTQYSDEVVACFEERENGTCAWFSEA